MNRLIRVNKNVAFALLIFLVLMFFLLYILSQMKIEVSSSIPIRTNADGTRSIITNPDMSSKIINSTRVSAIYHEKNYELTIGKYSINPDGNYIINFKGIKELLPGSNLQLNIITGYQTLFKSIFN